MPSSLTKFEAYISAADQASNPNDVETFLNALVALGIPIVTFQCIGVGTNQSSLGNLNAFFGLVNAAQSITALAALTTLNTALGHNITCFVSTVTTEP